MQDAGQRPVARVTFYWDNRYIGAPTGGAAGGESGSMVMPNKGDAGVCVGAALAQ
jgi:hypothetical protein